MNHKYYKSVITLFALCFLGTTFAQKFDKKITENFKVNKDVEVVINTSNAAINVTTWKKNEVQVQAFLEVEGLSKEAAEKYFKNENFEALGNSGKVKISLGNNSSNLRNDFLIFNDMDFTLPDIQMPDFDSIVLPEVNFDFDFDFDFENILEDLDDLDENMEKNGKYSFDWNDGVEKISIKSKKEWEAFKKSKKYQELKDKMSIEKEKLRKNFAESKEKMKIGLEKAKLKYEKIDKAEIKRSLAKAKKQIMEMKLNHSSNSGNITFNGKKIIIKKRLEIKVPENATFNLNTRHCKVKLPNTKAFGKVSYGNFNANNLNGGKLTIDYSKVLINNLNKSNLFLNNVTDAKITSVTNTTLSNNSSSLKIMNVNENVKIIDRFGELTIENIKPKYETFKLTLDNSEAKLNLSVANSKLKLSASNIIIPEKTTTNKKVSIFNGFVNTIDNDTFIIEGKNSKLTIIRDIL
ncbi:hypothetical protein SAMN05216503_1109 [Polaribacter sp. KT25b]|uniref:hypothetical protein n=1 Tax=Polaribacter sp. KT25b TaxID=1855336 RepID=UPI00087DCD17|nr:hypothetical protein [Polaribacter sp. KT25b]SDR83801.1 hypothetical protein SAMN05216503_1109 [Polaribacter sp. KT25b]